MSSCEQPTTMTGRLLTIIFDSSVDRPVAVIHERGRPDIRIEHGNEHVRIDNVQMKLVAKGRTLVISNQCWQMSASVKGFPNIAANEGKYLLHVQIEALYDADHAIVPPHGIIGQSYDGDEVAVSGAQDDYRHSGSEMTTLAQGDGALEGTLLDYRMQHLFATEFKYTRFESTTGQARNVSLLLGQKHKADANTVKMRAAGAGFATEDEEHQSVA